MSLWRRRPHRIHRSRSPLVWYLIITIVALLIAAVLGLGGGLINFIDKHADVLDTQYIPMDLDRKTVDELKERTKNLDRNTLEQLKKKFMQRQSQP